MRSQFSPFRCSVLDLLVVSVYSFLLLSVHQAHAQRIEQHLVNTLIKYSLSQPFIDMSFSPFFFPPLFFRFLSALCWQLMRLSTRQSRTITDRGNSTLPLGLTAGLAALCSYCDKLSIFLNILSSLNPVTTFPHSYPGFTVCESYVLTKC